ncbi:hypothetical protein BDF20DRAFT_813604 [Mycotypha africana]|uniref:uncharacterized protein n=1 Tax=Mycotypha africana TaxID=64632 RepID=UPI0023014AF2|nr:uncharacterized protein BDF20DRAFT_813604 [Mycotypha africana]KAI8988344.1 hypothetical protein BDF20DRAFT_813604 [Mycotypha africana]
MHNLGCHCRHITKLTLASCSNLTSISLLPFVDMPIEYLDLSGCKWLNASDTAYDISCLHSLTHLNLVCCDTINHDFIRSMVTATCLSKLQEFSITGGATLIDDNAIIPFIKTHPHVRGLFLLECAITDATLEAIATHMSFSLHHLDLSFCRHLTANGVRHLISHCHHLRLLGLKSCGLTQHDFPEIPIRAYPPTSVTADHYPHLNTLNYIELNYIREEYENHPQRRDEDVAESYGYIQQYLDSVVIQ